MFDESDCAAGCGWIDIDACGNAEFCWVAVRQELGVAADANMDV
jgi:hypothetical protein